MGRGVVSTERMTVLEFSRKGNVTAHDGKVNV